MEMDPGRWKLMAPETRVLMRRRADPMERVRVVGSWRLWLSICEAGGMDKYL